MNAPSVTFKLRQGVKFHDGSDFNADVAKFNMDAQIDSNKASNWKSVDIIDEYTIRVNLITYQNMAMDSFADNVLAFFASKEAYLKNGQEWADKNPVGTGPFVFVEYQQNTKAVFTRNDSYWQTGKPYLDGLEIHYVVDELTFMASMKAGELDMINVSMGKQQKDMEDAGFNSDATPMTVYGLIPDTANADSPLAIKHCAKPLSMLSIKYQCLKVWVMAPGSRFIRSFPG